MPRASRKPINGKLDQELRENFSTLISSLKTSQEIQQFFNDFITHEEQVMLSKRLMLHLMLAKGYSGSQIQAVLGINKDTIRVHKLLWEHGGAVYREIIGKISKKQEAKLFWEKLEKIFHAGDLLIKSRSNMRARAKIANGDWN